MNKEDFLSSLFFEAFNKKKSIRFILKGLSMYPVLREEDALTVKPITFFEAEFGDILAYQNVYTKNITVHRMVKRVKSEKCNTILTAAEAGNSFTYDQPLTPSEYIIARVITIERGARRINLASPVNILKAKIRTYILVHFHSLIRTQRKFYMLVDRLFRQG